MGNTVSVSESSIQLIITKTSEWARSRLKSPASLLFTQPFIQAQIKENFKAPRHWPLCGNSPETGEFPAQMASSAKKFPLDDVIMFAYINAHIWHNELMHNIILLCDQLPQICSCWPMLFLAHSIISQCLPISVVLRGSWEWFSSNQRLFRMIPPYWNGILSQKRKLQRAQRMAYHYDVKGSTQQLHTEQYLNQTTNIFSFTFFIHDVIIVS